MLLGGSGMVSGGFGWFRGGSRWFYVVLGGLSGSGLFRGCF